MGKWPPLSWFPVPLGTPVWLSGWDPGSSPLPPSRLRANLAPHLAQMYPLLPAPHPTSGLPQASFSHAAVRRTFPKSKLDHDSPAADPSQEASRYWPGLQGLVQLGPCLSRLLFTFSLPHSYTRAVRIRPIPLHQLFLLSGTPLLRLVLFLPEYSCSYSKAQRRGPSSRQISPISKLSLVSLLGPSPAHAGLLRLLS